MMPSNKDDETKQPIAVSTYIIAFLYNIVNSLPKLTSQVQHLVTKKEAPLQHLHRRHIF